MNFKVSLKLVFGVNWQHSLRFTDPGLDLKSNIQVREVPIPHSVDVCVRVRVGGGPVSGRLRPDFKLMFCFLLVLVI